MRRYGMGSMRMPHPTKERVPDSEMSKFRPYIQTAPRRAVRDTVCPGQRNGSTRCDCREPFPCSCLESRVGRGMRLTDTRHLDRGAPICVPGPYMHFWAASIVCFSCHVKTQSQQPYTSVIFENTEKTQQRKEPKGTLWQKQDKQDPQAS